MNLDLPIEETVADLDEEKKQKEIKYWDKKIKSRGKVPNTRHDEREFGRNPTGKAAWLVSVIIARKIVSFLIIGFTGGTLLASVCGFDWSATGLFFVLALAFAGLFFLYGRSKIFAISSLIVS